MREKLAEKFPLEEHNLKTMEEYFATDMNISKTAANLSLHRNSVIYRLNKIAEKISLDPRKTKDIVQLKLSLLAYKYRNS